VIDPAGVTRVCAPSDREAVVIYDIEPMSVRSLVPRRPALYRALTEPTESLPIARLLAEPLVPADADARLAVVPSNGGFDAARTARLFREARAHGAGLVVFGGEDGPEGWQVALPELEAAARDAGGAMVVGVTTTGCSVHQSAVIVTSGGSTEHVASHGRGIQLGEAVAPVVATPIGNVGVLCGDEGYVPEVARSLMLRGAEFLAWPAFAELDATELIARTRADENRVYGAVAWPGGGMVISPTAAPLAVAPHGTHAAMAAQVNRTLTRWKDMAPGTHVVTDRIPEAYGALVR
jgi:hypothetical protein